MYLCVFQSRLQESNFCRRDFLPHCNSISIGDLLPPTDQEKEKETKHSCKGSTFFADSSNCQMKIVQNLTKICSPAKYVLAGGPPGKNENRSIEVICFEGIMVTSGVDGVEPKFNQEERSFTFPTTTI